MSKMNTSHRYIYDAAPATLLRARTAAAVTSTGDSSVVVLDTLKGFWNTAGELADETFAIVINVTDLDATTGDETYSLAAKATNAAGVVNNAAALGTLAINAVGQYVILVDAATVKKVASNFGGVKLTATLAGTTPSITYHSWISQIVKA